MTCVLLSPRVANVSDVEFAADISYFVLSKETFVWCFLVRRTALCMIRTAGKLVALKPVFIALPLNGDCEMHGSRENATSKFRVDISTPSPLLYIFSVTIPQDLESSYCSHCFMTCILNILIIDEFSRRSTALH